MPSESIHVNLEMDDLCDIVFKISGAMKAHPFKVIRSLQALAGETEEWSQELARCVWRRRTEQPEYIGHWDPTKGASPLAGAMEDWMTFNEIVPYLSW